MIGSAGDDTIRGDNAANTLHGGAGDDTLDGRDGIDSLLGGLGADFLDGGIGVDTARYANSDLGVTLDLTTGGTAGDAQGDTYSGIETVVGSNFTNLITGDGAGNLLDSGNGDDTLNGGGGSDTLEGGRGSDGLAGGEGNDVLRGGDDNDRLNGGTGADVADGGAGNDQFFVQDGELTNGDTFIGGSGNDTLIFFTSVNISGNTLSSIESVIAVTSLTMTVQQLNDVSEVSIDADPVSQNLRVANAGTIDLSEARVNQVTMIFSDAGNTVLYGTDGDFFAIRGGASADTITAVDNVNTFGGITVEGRGGNDILTGSMSTAGGDLFEYNASANNGIDTITNFSGTTAFGGGTGEGDRIVVNVAGNPTFQYLGDAAFTGAAGTVQARVSGDHVLIDANSDLVADIEIVLTGLTDASQLVAGDFFLA